MTGSVHTKNMSLEQALRNQVQTLCQEDSANEETLRSIRLTILIRTAQILRIPFDPTTDVFRSTDFTNNRIVLSLETLRALDKAWSRITCTFTDNRVTNLEKHVREQLFFNAPYYTDRTQLIRFINILAKRDTSRSLLKTTLLNHVLAIDGFRGILPSQCRNYTGHLNDRLPILEKTHLEATRSLYASSDLCVDSFSGGTVAAGLVLLALLKLYMDRVGHRMDRATRHVADKAVECVSNFIHDNNNRGGRLKRRIEKISRRYRKVINDDSLLEGIAFRKLIDYGKHALPKYLP